MNNIKNIYIYIWIHHWSKSESSGNHQNLSHALWWSFEAGVQSQHAAGLSGHLQGQQRWQPLDPERWGSELWVESPWAIWFQHWIFPRTSNRRSVYHLFSNSKKMCQNLVWPCTIGFPCHTFHPVFRGPIRRCIIGDRPAALDHPIWPGFGGLGVQWFWWKPQHGDHDRFGSVLLDHQDTWCYWSIDDGPQCISNAEGDWVDQSLHLVLLLVNFIRPKV